MILTFQRFRVIQDIYLKSKYILQGGTCKHHRTQRRVKFLLSDVSLGDLAIVGL